MGFFSNLAASLKNAVSRKKRDAQWDARFTNPPADSSDALPLDPGRSDLR